MLRVSTGRLASISQQVTQQLLALPCGSWGSVAGTTPWLCERPESAAAERARPRTASAAACLGGPLHSTALLGSCSIIYSMYQQELVLHLAVARRLVRVHLVCKGMRCLLTFVDCWPSQSATV